MKTTNILRLLLLLTVFVCSTLVNAQTTYETKRFNNYPSMEQAKKNISDVLYEKHVSVSDSLGKINYKEAKVFDDRIELITKKDVRVFFFRDMFNTGDKNEITVFCSKEHFKNGETFPGAEHDYYDCYIDNLKSIRFKDSYRKFTDGTAWGDDGSIYVLADALNSFQHQQTKVYQDSVNNNIAQKLKNDLAEFQAAAKTYKELQEKPAITEEQRKYIVQANALNNEKRYAEALSYYEKVITIHATAYPPAYYNMALIEAQIGKYRKAIFNMKKYLFLVPDAPDARAAQDKIYEWELKQ